jgi:hypothetical protein
MQYEPKWLVIYALALEAKEQSDESLALVAKNPVLAFQPAQVRLPDAASL